MLDGRWGREGCESSGITRDVENATDQSDSLLFPCSLTLPDWLENVRNKESGVGLNSCFGCTKINESVGEGWRIAFFIPGAISSLWLVKECVEWSDGIFIMRSLVIGEGGVDEQACFVFLVCWMTHDVFYNLHHQSTFCTSSRKSKEKTTKIKQQNWRNHPNPASFDDANEQKSSTFRDQRSIWCTHVVRVVLDSDAQVKVLVGLKSQLSIGHRTLALPWTGYWFSARPRTSFHSGTCCRWTWSGRYLGYRLVDFRTLRYTTIHPRATGWQSRGKTALDSIMMIIMMFRIKA